MHNLWHLVISPFVKHTQKNFHVAKRKYSDLLAPLHVTAWIFLYHTYCMCRLVLYAWQWVWSPSSALSIIYSCDAATPPSHLSNLFKSGEHFCWHMYERVTPIYDYLCQPLGRWLGKGWEKAVWGWRVVIYLPIALLPAPVLFDEAYLWIIKTHRSLVECCQPCCWCREQSVSPTDCMTDAVCRTETRTEPNVCAPGSLQHLYLCELALCL